MILMLGEFLGVDTSNNRIMLGWFIFSKDWISLASNFWAFWSSLDLSIIFMATFSEVKENYIDFSGDNSDNSLLP